MNPAVSNTNIWRWLLIVLAVFIIVGPMQAQAPTATLVGRITDASQAVIPGATVEVRKRRDEHRAQGHVERPW